MRFLAAVLPLLALPAYAHHGAVPWDTAREVVLEGFVSREMEMFPHWEIRIRVDGEDWVLDLENGHEMEQAGLHEDGRAFDIGDEIVVRGYVPEDPGWKRISPLVVELEGERFEFSIPHD